MSKEVTEILITWRDGDPISAERKASIERQCHTKLLRDAETPYTHMSVVTPINGVSTKHAIRLLERFHEVQFAEINAIYTAQ